MHPACTAVNRYGPLLGRILLSAIFIISGWGKIGHFAQTAGYMASKGLPFTDVLLAITIAIELGAGLMLLVGWKARWAATIIFLWLIPTTFIFHAFWAAPAAEMQNQMIHFMKNLAIMGGMLYVMSFGAGPLSVGGERHNTAERTRV